MARDCVICWQSDSSATDWRRYRSAKYCCSAACSDLRRRLRTAEQRLMRYYLFGPRTQRKEQSETSAMLRSYGKVSSKPVFTDESMQWRGADLEFRVVV